MTVDSYIKYDRNKANCKIAEKTSRGEEGKANCNHFFPQLTEYSGSFSQVFFLQFSWHPHAHCVPRRLISSWKHNRNLICNLTEVIVGVFLVIAWKSRPLNSFTSLKIWMSHLLNWVFLQKTKPCIHLVM